MPGQSGTRWPERRNSTLWVAGFGSSSIADLRRRRICEVIGEGAELFDGYLLRAKCGAKPYPFKYPINIRCHAIQCGSQHLSALVECLCHDALQNG